MKYIIIMSIILIGIIIYFLQPIKEIDTTSAANDLFED